MQSHYDRGSSSDSSEINPPNPDVDNAPNLLSGPSRGIPMPVIPPISPPNLLSDPSRGIPMPENDADNALNTERSQDLIREELV